MRSGERSIGWFQRQIEWAIGTSSAARGKARSWGVGGAGLIILCLLVYIPGLWTIPPVDRDESRFAQASRQMLESGTVEGWVVPMVQDKPRLNKPPLIYWLQAGSAAVLGDKPGQWAWLDGGSENIWVYRVPSVLSAMLAVVLTWRIGMRMFDPRAAWLAAALLAVCPMVVWDAHQARADQLLLAMTTATMMCLWSVWREGRRLGPNQSAHTRRTPSAECLTPNVPALSDGSEGDVSELGDRRSAFGVGQEDLSGLRVSRTPGECSTKNARATVTQRVTQWLRPSVVLFWLFLSLGIMTKGPITPMVAGLTVLTLCLVSRDWSLVRRLRPVMGVVIVLLVVGPWVALVGNEVGWSKYVSIVYDETIGRSAGAKEGHWGPPGYHIVLLGVLFWPGSLLTAAAIGRACKRGLVRRNLNTETTAGTKRAEEARKAWFTSLGGTVSSWLSGLYHARPGRDAELFCLAWMLPTWVVFELIGTKLPHYTMPMYPAVAMMSARMVLSANTVKRSRPDLGSAAWTIFGGVFLIGLPVALSLGTIKMLPDKTGLNFIDAALGPVVLGVLGTVIYIITARVLLRRRGVLYATIIASLLWVVAAAFVFGTMLPSAKILWNSQRVWQAVRQVDMDYAVVVCSYDYKEDSLVFLSRGRFQRLDNAQDVLEAVRKNQRGVVVSAQGDWWKEVTGGDTPIRGIDPTDKLDAGLGFNYSTGKWIEPWVFGVRSGDR